MFVATASRVLEQPLRALLCQHAEWQGHPGARLCRVGTLSHSGDTKVREELEGTVSVGV